jgi:hypothetical protein
MGRMLTVAIVTRQSRLAGLKARWGTAKQAEFRLQQAAAHERELRFKRKERSGVTISKSDIQNAEVAAEALAETDEYEQEHQIYHAALERLIDEVGQNFRVEVIDRTLLSTFDFARCEMVVVIGQDGLVANTAKYALGLPIIGVNPDPARYDGILLPYQAADARRIVRAVHRNQAKYSEVTLAQVDSNDGQSMLAFNDFFVGCASHVSARYTLENNGMSEAQSSSGVLISTGAGSTGWFSSLCNMTAAFSRFAGAGDVSPIRLSREERRIVWAVREPFASNHSGISQVAGFLNEGEELVIGSQMPTHGVIFSDGIESDFIEFNSGTIARFSVSDKTAKLVVS